ncbi:NF-kappa-B inhibitor-interacting Ras-like protein 1 [Lineus longissimus]|uniref:NF-kappa-B inhibitor-interacting Ras-like protein 1 n=1 Tax=Lineus longissimus TaxID=88925 RepID=UPI002B4DFFAA
MGKTSKVVVCGLAAAGKTAILEQLIYGNHTIGTQTYSTIEDTYVAFIETDRGVKEKVRFYDTGGLDSMKPELPKHLLNSADGFVLVYDITNPESYKCVEKVRKEIDKYSQTGRKEGSVIVLGNKADLEESRQVETSVAQKWAHKEKVKLFEVSVKNRQTLMEGFIALASKLTQPPPKSSFLTKKVKGVSSSSAAADS